MLVHVHVYTNVYVCLFVKIVYNGTCENHIFNSKFADSNEN